MDIVTKLESACTLKEPRTYDKLWLPDGNIVLATDSHLFKVHKSVLAMQSTVFRDMFDIPTVDYTQTSFDDTDTSQKTFEGIPVVNLIGDKGEDVVHLLHTVYERQYYQNDNDDTPLEAIVALLLLSTKYDFAHIRKDVVRHISKHFPMNLAACDAAKDYTTPLFGTTQEQSHFSLLKALRTANVDALLPSAFYVCSDYRTEVLKKRAEILGLECITTLMAGKHDLLCEANELVAAVFGDLFVQSGVRYCASCGGRASLLSVHDGINFGDMRFLEGNIVADRCLSGLCVECKPKLVDLINEDRQELWNKVPRFFGFPVGWDVLQAKLNEILSPED